MSYQTGANDRVPLGELLHRMTLGDAGSRNAVGDIEAILGVEGWVLFGPYLPMPPGPYSVRMIFAQASLPAAATNDSGIVLEAAWNLKTIAALRLDEPSFDAGMVALQFSVPDGAPAQEGLEIRVHTRGESSLTVTSIDLRQLTLGFPRHLIGKEGETTSR